MKQRFEIGDRVRITHLDSDTCGEEIGDTGVVVETAPLKAVVFFDNPDVDAWFFFSRWDSDAPAIKENIITTEQANESRCWWVMNDRLEIARPIIDWIE